MYVCMYVCMCTTYVPIYSSGSTQIENGRNFKNFVWSWWLPDFCWTWNLKIWKNKLIKSRKSTRDVFPQINEGQTSVCLSFQTQNYPLTLRKFHVPYSHEDDTILYYFNCSIFLQINRIMNSHLNLIKILNPRIEIVNWKNINKRKMISVHIFSFITRSNYFVISFCMATKMIFLFASPSS